MAEFCEHAIAVAVLGHQKNNPWRFPETNEFRKDVIAEGDRVCVLQDRL